MTANEAVKVIKEFMKEHNLSAKETVKFLDDHQKEFELTDFELGLIILEIDGIGFMPSRCVVALENSKNFEK